MKTAIASGVLLFVAVAASAADGQPELGLPLKCELGTTCFVQQYVDNDPGPGASDFMCGSAVYDGHKGTDIRIVTTADVERGVPVIASAAGVVRGVRDGMADRLVKSKADKARVAKRECGNGVVLLHDDGWETQYCHLRRGSVVVGKGAKVSKGQKLGDVGFSGDAGFAHVHLSVRHNGDVVDPYRGLGGPAGCGPGPRPLWDGATAATLDYAPTQLLGVGVADRAVKLTDAEHGTAPDLAPTSKTAALVVWGWAINLKKGDVLSLRLEGPNGEVASSETPMERSKAQYIGFAGQKRPGSGWPPGQYRTEVSVVRDGDAIRQSKRAFEIR